MGDASLEGRICLVTGATSGIGEETALGLARLGAHVILVGRDRDRVERSRARIVADSGNAAVDGLLGDFASLASVRRLAERFLATHPALHVLVNNAGVVNLRRTLTQDGFESTFAVNHLAPFALTLLLLDRLRQSAPARIVNVASDAHRFGRLDLDDLQSERRYRAMRVYGASKLANILFTSELARRLEASGVTANSVHPGAVATRLGTNNGWLGRVAVGALRPFFLTPAQGADTSIYLASSAEVEAVSGRYFVKRRERAPSFAGRDPSLAARLWERSCELTRLAGPPPAATA
jgi:retinol dehydrogenase-12